MSEKDNFINEELITVDPFEFGRIYRSDNHGFGGLGVGILRPDKKKKDSRISKDVDVSNFKYDLLQLTDKEKTAQLAEQIAKSIQDRIDKAAKEASSKKKTEEAELAKKSNSGFFIGAGILSAIVVTGILIYAFKKVKLPKLKTAKL